MENLIRQPIYQQDRAARDEFSAFSSNVACLMGGGWVGERFVLRSVDSPLASLVRPPARHPPVAGFRSPSFRPPCIHEAHFRHRGAPVSGFLRPLATVAAWHPGPATPFRGKASIPPGVVSTGSGASVRRDLPGFVSACVHPCPTGNGSSYKFLPHPSASTGACIRPSLRSDVDLLCPLSTLSLATGQAFTIADPDHASSFSLPQNCSKKPPPRLKYQSRSRHCRRHTSFRHAPRRCIRENPVMYSSPLRVYRSFHCAPCGST